MKKQFSLKNAFVLLGVVLFGITSITNAQTVVPIGASSLNKTIQSAYDAIKTTAVSTPISGAYVLELQSDYDLDGAKLETFPISLTAINGASATNNITIRPATGVSKIITNTASPASYTYTTTAASTITKIKVADVTGMTDGMKIAGTGITNGTTITVDATNKIITLSAPATTSMVVGSLLSVGTNAYSDLNNNDTNTSGTTTITFATAVGAGVAVGDFVTGHAGIAVNTKISIISADRKTITLDKAVAARVTASNRITFGTYASVPTVVTNSVALSSAANLTAGMIMTGVGSAIVASVNGSTITFEGGSLPIATSKSLVFSNNASVFSFEGARFVTIDGQSGGIGGAKALTISSTNTSPVASTLNFINDAYKNIVKYCTVLGAGASTTTAPVSGVVFIGPTTGTTARAGSAPNFTGSGNLYNTIDNCDIAETSVNTLPSVGVYVVGTATFTNEGNAITNCNIANYFNPGAFISSGIYNDLNSQTTTITGNKLYQAATRTYTGNGLHYPIYINTAGAVTAITDNVIGYSSSIGTGRTIITNGDPVSLTVAPKFAGIFINNCLGGTNPNILGNTITAIDFTSASLGSAAQGVVVGIYQQAGNLTTATTAKPNVISDINLYYSVSTTATFGLAGYSYSFGSGSASYSNTIVNGLSAIPVGTNANTIIGKVIGIYSTGSYGGSGKINKVYNLSCGVSGSTVAHTVQGISINIGSNQANSLERNLVYNLNAISTGASIISGLACSAGTGVSTYKSNIIALGNEVTSGAEIRGIYKSTNTKDLIYHNSVFIGGIASGTTANTYAYYRNAATPTAAGENMKNNIFVNQRSGGTTGIHYAMKMLNTADYSGAFIAATHNLLKVGTETNNKLAFIGTEIADYTAFTTSYPTFATGCTNADPSFIAPTSATPNLGITLSSTVVDAVGTTIAAVTDDFYGSVRADLTACDLGAVAYISTATGPTTTITSTATANTKTSPIPVVIKFSNTVTGFDASKITVSNGTLGTVSGSGNSYSVSVTPSGQGVVTVDILAGVVIDAVGNGNIAGTLSRTYDNVAPTVAITSPSAESTNAVIPVTITFSESVTGFDVTDLTLVNGVASNFVAVSATEYTVDITAAALGDVKVDIAAGKAADAATNGNAIATQLKVAYGTSGLVNVNDILTVYSVNNSIVIKASLGQTARIYSVGGQLVKSIILTSSRVSVPSAAGFYVVNVGTQNTKVLVK
jgi:hypothetical protein